MNYNHDQKVRKEQLSNLLTYGEKPVDVKFTSGPSVFKYSEFNELYVKKLNPKATIPTRANPTDAGYDLYALDGAIIEKHSHKLIKTGISLEIPKGYAGFIWPRSGLSYKNGLDVFAGVIDSGYRGDVGVILYNSQYNDYCVEAGDRIAQIVFQKVENLELVEVNYLDDSDRGSGGFGSTGS